MSRREPNLRGKDCKQVAAFHVEEARMTTTNEPGTVCVANIGPWERRKRMRFGVALLVVGAVLAAVLVGLQADRLWRLLLFLPFWAGTAGVLQAREKT